MSFIDSFRDGFPGYLKGTGALYLAMVVLLVLGVALGAAAVNVLDRVERVELARYLEVFLRGLVDGQLRTDPALALRAACLQNLKTIGFLWALGLIGIGVPVIAAVVLLRGMVIGFTVGFLVEEMGVAGFFMAALAVLPQNLLVLPALVVTAVSSLSFSLLLLRRRWERAPRPLVEELMGYSFAILLMGGVMLAAAFLEAYVAPVFMRLIAAYTLPQ